MFSFTKIVSFAVLALGTLVSASAIPAVKSVVVVSPKATIKERDGTSLASVFADLTTSLQPVLCSSIVAGLPGTTDPVALQSGITQVTSLIQSASSTLSGLTSQPQSQTLSTLDGTGLLSVTDVAGLLGGTLTSVLGVLGPLTSGVGAVGTVGLLTPLLAVITTLLTVVLTLVGASALALVTALLPLIITLIPTLLSLLLPIILGLLLL
ncbi:hypothetical protein HETIRDRAFT_429559 [Heterobasidion irregulare TC 32-1]|uniref:Uncharacterized protein n=1 Tax=Heterobasidion irregulare (strain TC 32-1) TaxID=747525 RepID=W4JW13_HETIT|nr:uncharacterized protein HETIRDRAFT_429559 [Heterobasidion irregulare TC 32-1]ETW77260.1 hypothetical protein HETIRDRAFT_429559 [Heterobasidion irregulare TC 32-1]